MIPKLFAENKTTFTTNGIGSLSDAVFCNVIEERNGQFELTMRYPDKGRHFSDIGLRSIILAKPSAGQNAQPFRIYKISKPINGVVTINAQHISYDLSKNVSMPFNVTASASACQSALTGLKTNAVESCPFTFSTDNTTVASFGFDAPASIRQMMGGVSGSILDQFGGEYQYDGYTVYLKNHRGSSKNIPLRYGKNITDIKQEENISSTITGIVPYWSDSEGGEVVTLTEKVIHSSNASSYSNYLTVVMDFSSDFDEKPTENQLRVHAQAYVNSHNLGIPKVSIDVSFVNLADTVEYKDILSLQQLELCDTIPIIFEKLGINTTAKVVKTDYDVLADKYNSITVGDPQSTLATSLSGINDNVTALANTTRTNFIKLSNEIQEDIDNATAWLTATGGVIRALKNSDDEWTDLLCMSATATASTGNVLRFNVNGIGFSSTGWNGPFTQAWTLDGKLVIGGTNVPSITVYDLSNNIIFQADATKIIWNTPNSTLTADGTITVYDTSTPRKIIFQASKDAMIWNATNSSMNASGIISMKGAQLEDGDIQMKHLEYYDEDDNPIYSTLELTSSDVKIKSQGTPNFADGQTIEISKGRIRGYSSVYPSHVSEMDFYSDSSTSNISITTDRLYMNSHSGYTGQVSVPGGIKQVVNGIILS